MSRKNNRDDRGLSGDEAPAPSSQSSQGRMNRREEMAQWQGQQQRQHSSFAAGMPPSNLPGGQQQQQQPSSMSMSQEQMTMPPDLRYLQEMLRAEEFIMASQGGGLRSGGAPLAGPRGMSAMPSSRSTFPSSGQWTDASAASRGMRNMPQGTFSYSGLDSSSVARMPSNLPWQQDPSQPDPAMLLSLLQQEQERLLQIQRQQQAAMPEAWLPPSKRQRLPYGMDPYGLSQSLAAQQGGMIPPQQEQGYPPPPKSEPKQRKRHVKSFPTKLMEAMNELHDESVLAWLPDGRSFVVVNPDNFADKVLASTFKGGKYTSFVRKLNRWGFSRLISGTGMDCFHNPLFQRDRPELCRFITSGSADDTVGVERSLLNRKPSLAGIERFFEMRDVGGKSKQHTTEAGKLKSESEDKDANDNDDDEDKKPAAVEDTTKPSSDDDDDGDDDDDDTKEESKSANV